MSFVLKIVCTIRSFLATAFFVVLTAILGLFMIVGMLVFRNQKWSDLVLLVWSRLSFWAHNVEVTIEGVENYPTEGCLFLFNHASHFDIPAFYYAIRKSARFGAKIELFSIPIFGPAMRAAGILPIERADRTKVLNLYAESIARVKAGESFVLAAEGTRQRLGGVGEKFKTGPFIFAISGQFPLVPVVIYGASECLPRGDLLACTSRWRSTIRIRILPPVATAGLTEQDRVRLQTEMRENMARAYQELEQLQNRA